MDNDKQLAASSSASSTPSLTADPADHLWQFLCGVTQETGFAFSPECEGDLRERIRLGIKQNRVGLYEFRERKLEAEQNLERLLRTMISEEQSKAGKSKLLSQAGLFSALYGCNLCPGLWPLC